MQVEHIRLTPPRVESALGFNSLKAHPFHPTLSPLSLFIIGFKCPTCTPYSSEDLRALVADARARGAVVPAAEVEAWAVGS